MNLGKSLKIALAMKEMKQKDLASKMGVSQQQISNWAATGRISTNNQMALSHALGMKFSELIALGE